MHTRLLAFTLLAIGRADILQLADLSSPRIASLDRAKTVVILPGGMLEEHGPYLPASTDAILSGRLTRDVSQSIQKAKPDWNVLVFPQLPAGSSGSNELGNRFSFAGTYTVRPSTLRSIYMDLASELGDQGFRWILVIHVHGAPWHNHVLDQAGDYFHDTYGGQMVNLWGLVPVLSAWGKAMQSMTPAEQKEDGVSLHGGMDETSLLLYLRPELVDKGYRQAPPIAGDSYESAMETAKRPGWTGYLGSPRLATADWGRRIWTALSDSAAEHALKILNGVDPSQYPRYADLLGKNRWYSHWIRAAEEHDREQENKQRRWMEKQPPFGKPAR
jgi:creatinine amidohydrolase